MTTVTAAISDAMGAPMSFPDEWLEDVTACGACGSGAADAWLSLPCEEHPGVEFHIVQCRECGLRYLTPRPVISRIGAYYASDYYSYVFHPMRSRRHMLKMGLWRLLGMLPPPARQGTLQRLIRQGLLAFRGPVAHWTMPPPADSMFLDLGSGAGDRLEIAREMGWTTCGVDLGVESLVALRARGHLAVAANMQALPLDAETSTYVNLSHSLEHVHDPVGVLRECGRVLEPGGIANIVVPNVGGWGVETYGINYRGLDVPRHLYHFTPDTLRGVAVAAGLRPIALYTEANAWVLQESQRLANGGPLPSRRQIRQLNRSLQGEIINLWCEK